MRPQRYHLRVSVGNLLELAGAAAGVYGLARIAGLGYALLLLAILLIIGAELIYDATVLRVPLPRRPHPAHAIKQAATRVERWRWDRHVRKLLQEKHVGGPDEALDL